MNTCFLFMASWSADGADCVVLTADNEIVGSLKKYNVEEIKALQAAATLKIVVPTAEAAIHTVTLPWLGERRSREALPFALEEQLSTPVAEVQIAFSKAFYQQGQYLVIVVDKKRCLDWLEILKSNEIVFDSMFIDWFALNPHELLITDVGLLVYADDFKGELGASLAKKYVETHPPLSGVRCRDSHLDLQLAKEEKCKERVYLWLAKRLNKAHSIDLCQGELSPIHQSISKSRTFTWVAGLFLAWIGCVLVVNTLYLLQLRQATTQLNVQINQFYQRFFPHETQVANPRFRIEQLLKTNASTQQRVFWFLLNALAKVVQKKSNISIQQVKFQDHQLEVKLTSPDFSSLEQFENELKRASVNAVQISAASLDNQVSAVLELKE